MAKDQLSKYRENLNKFSEDAQIEQDLYLRKLALGEIQGPMTGFPSLDKTWLKYYSEDQIKNKAPYMNVVDFIEYQNKDNLDGIAIDGYEGIYTYRDLFAIRDKVANSLYKLGTSKGKKVMMMFPNISYEDFVFYGTAKTGAAIFPLVPEYTPNQVCEAINETNAEFFFIFDALLTKEMEESIYTKTKLKNIIDVSFAPLQNRDARTLSWEDFLNIGKDYEMPNIKRNPEDLLFIAKTGGTTGKAKSVMLNDTSFITLVHQYINSDLPYDKGDRWLRLWPIFSATAAVSSFFLAHAAGMQEVIRFFPKFEEFGDLVLETKSNHLILIPMLLDALEKSNTFDNQDLSFIKSAGCGGMPVTKNFEIKVKKFFEKYNLPIFLGYGWGQTEHGSSAAGRMNEETNVIGTVGIPWVKTTVSVFKPQTEEELSFEEEGELCISSNSIMMGYYNDEELTGKVKWIHGVHGVDGTHGVHGRVWLHTGDLGVVHNNGFVQVNGRITRSILTFPTSKVYPTALEDIIASIPGVENVAVVGAPDPENAGFEIIICYLVASPLVNPEELKENIDKFLSSKFPPNGRPAHYITRDFLPLTSVGKPDVTLLANEYQTNNVLKRKKD